MHGVHAYPCLTPYAYMLTHVNSILPTSHIRSPAPLPTHKPLLILQCHLTHISTA